MEELATLEETGGCAFAAAKTAEAKTAEAAAAAKTAEAAAKVPEAEKHEVGPPTPKSVTDLLPLLEGVPVGSIMITKGGHLVAEYDGKKRYRSITGVCSTSTQLKARGYKRIAWGSYFWIKMSTSRFLFHISATWLIRIEPLLSPDLNLSRR